MYTVEAPGFLKRIRKKEARTCMGAADKKKIHFQLGEKGGGGLQPGPPLECKNDHMRVHSFSEKEVYVFGAFVSGRFPEKRNNDTQFME